METWFLLLKLWIYSPSTYMESSDAQGMDLEKNAWMGM